MTTELLAISALVIGGIVWLLVARPRRAIIAIGFATGGALSGYLVGFVVGAFQYSLIDGSSLGYVTSAMIGGGVGLVMGAALGLVCARRAESVSSSQAWVLRALAAGAVLSGLVARGFEATLVMPGSSGQRHFLAGLQRATMADAILAGVLLLVVAGRGRGRAGVLSDDAGLRLLGATGLVLGLLAWVVVVIVAAGEPTGVHHPAYERQQSRLSVDRLTASALRYHHQHGVFPPDIATLLAAGGGVATGSRVKSIKTTRRGRYCIVVGVDLGDGETGPPFEGGLIDATRLIGTGSAAC